MKPKDIIVGAKYRNTRHPGAIYLGVGKGRADKTRRANTFILTTDYAYGQFTTTYEDNPSFWGAFVLDRSK
jgi:hypothetical protein